MSEEDGSETEDQNFEDRSLLLGESLTASYRQSTTRRNLSAEEGNSPWSMLTFSWPKKLLQQGTRFGIQTPEQAMAMPKDLRTQYCVNNFGVSDLVRPLPLYTRDSSTTQLDQAGLEELTKLWKKIASVYGFKFFMFGLFQMIALIATFCKPLILSQLLNYMESSVKDPSEGFAWAGLMIAVSVLEGLVSVHLDYQLQRMKLSLRAVLISCVYEKCTLVSKINFNKKSLGEILTLMSTDCDRLSGAITNLHQLWSVPLQCISVLILLYFQVGYIFFIGLGFSIVMIFINRWIGGFIGKVNAKFMAAKDARIKLVSDIIYSIRMVKMHSLEKIFGYKIIELRKTEINELSKVKYLDAACVYFWATTPVLLSVILFAIFAANGDVLTASKVFTSLALINMLIFPLNAYPWVINGTMEGWISLQRLQELIDLKVIDYQYIYTPFESEVQQGSEEQLYGLSPSKMPSLIKVDNASFSHNSDRFQAPILKDLNLKIGRSDFVGIVGGVGAGKSSLLLGMLGELEKTDGIISMNDNHDGIAIVTQDPWIFNGTIRENILFGSFYNPEWYRQVIESCALLADFGVWPYGDLTKVGEGGSTLSGGQKARISLARQVYQQKEIYFLDDIFSQLDGQVCAHIYENCIMGILRDSAKVLISHQPQYLKDARIVFVIKDGQIVDSGSPSDLLGVELSNTLRSETPDDKLVAEPINLEENDDEARAEGAVSISVYKTYANAMGSFLSVIIMLSILLMQTSKSITDWWLTVWIHHDNSSAQYELAPIYRDHSETYQTPMLGWEPSDWNLSYLKIFIILGCINSFITALRAGLFAKGGLDASKQLHTNLLKSILGVKPSWFDKNPPGRIINRFSSDINEADDCLPFILNIFLNDTVQLIGTIVVITYALPWFIIIIIPLLPFYTSLQNYYRYTARDLKRLQATSLSPIYQHFSETLNGAVTIRALRKQQQEVLKNTKLLELNQRIQFSTLAANCWLNFRLTVGIGSVVIGITTLIAVIQHEYADIDPALVGLALSYSLPLTGILSAFMRDFLSTELGFISVERIAQYSNLQKEGLMKKYARLNSWPTLGVIEFLKVKLQYTEGGELALNGVSFKINAGEHVAVVGRTGSGKSSLINVILKMVDNVKGTVKIDNVDTGTLDAKNVRRNVTSISQDAFLFSGSVRFNLNPEDIHTDVQIYSALQKVDLEEKVAQMGGLDGLITERGGNLSSGEKQLFCLARALLQKNKVVLIDEATSSVDLETDAKIQKIIQSELRGSTVISIQHRLDNVKYFDRVMVMEFGNIIQYDKPTILIKDEEGYFAKLLKNNSSE